MKNARKRQDLAADMAAVRKMAQTIGRTVREIRKDTQFLVRCVSAQGRGDVVRLTIEGARLKQFNLVRAYMRLHPERPLYQACRFAWRRDAGGYPSVRSLHRFCLAHLGMIA